MLEAICLMIAWISLIISLSLFSLETLESNQTKQWKFFSKEMKKIVTSNTNKFTLNSTELPVLNDLTVSLNAEVPPL